MNPALAVALSGAVDSALMCAAILGFKRCGVPAQLATPYNGAILSVCWLAQIFFSSRADSMWESSLLVVLIGCAGVSVVTDLATGYILDSVTVPSLAAAFLIGAIDGRLVPILVGAFSVSAAILLLYVLSCGHGIGLGDAKLAACVGALLGTRNGLTSLGFAFVLGGLYAAVLLLLFRNASRKQSVAFAPYLAAGVLIELTLRTA